ncbi:hypothetical protein DSAG12_02408 [Promethearchaeum syntrophicum]|uniref:Uncharacterized protein n=1 Tax=Promethearchaeum syntrophicum TaxID=2594042 RepID=A0A5B9DBM3_9ARCH|nr:hypothetical protein [Candidatus Prometheoarchaeum syntrophicum]QEE16578.1 hypothetical protein DSAG12_02408 [Candidatus Prometheoarchaeum syntrophicum]
MVEVKFGLKNPYKVYIVRNWRDLIDQIRISSIFTIGLLIVAIYQNIIHNNTRIYFYIWPLISLILLIYFLIPTSKITFDLEKNFWKIQYYAIVPIKKFEGTISSLTKIISTENIDERKKYKYSLKNSKLYSDLSVLESNNEGEYKKKIIYSNKTYSYQSHKYNVKQNEKIGIVLENFFQNLNIQIEFEKLFNHFPNTNIKK